MLTIILQTSATSQSWWHNADNNGHYLKDILSSSDRDAIGNGFAETYNPYKVEDSALHIHIPFLVNYTPALPNFGQKRFWNRVPRFPINGTPCSTLKQIYVFCTLKFGKQYLFKNHLRLWFEMCSMFVCFVGSKSWSFTTLLIGCWQKVTQNDGTDICSRHKGPHQERTVNLDKRCRINVTFYPTVVRHRLMFLFFIYLYMITLDLSHEGKVPKTWKLFVTFSMKRRTLSPYWTFWFLKF